MFLESFRFMPEGFFDACILSYPVYLAIPAIFEQ